MKKLMMAIAMTLSFGGAASMAAPASAQPGPGHDRHFDHRGPDRGPGAHHRDFRDDRRWRDDRRGWNNRNWRDDRRGNYLDDRRYRDDRRWRDDRRDWNDRRYR